MNTTQIAQFLGSIGGKKSVQKRFAGKTKEEISEMMRKVRYTKTEEKEMSQMAKEFVKGLNKGMT